MEKTRNLKRTDFATVSKGAEPVKVETLFKVIAVLGAIVAVETVALWTIIFESLVAR